MGSLGSAALQVHLGVPRAAALRVCLTSLVRLPCEGQSTWAAGGLAVSQVLVKVVTPIGKCVELKILLLYYENQKNYTSYLTKNETKNDFAGGSSRSSIYSL